MSIERRLKRLESLARATLLAHCPSCRGPVPGTPSLLIVDEHDAPVQPMCKSCGLPLDTGGRGMGYPESMGMHTKVIVLAREMPV